MTTQPDLFTPQSRHADPSAARRMVELVRDGRVFKTGHTSETGSGRQAAVYKAV